MTFRSGILLLLLVTFLLSCKQDNAISKAILNTEVQIQVDRFDSIFANAVPDELPKLKKGYPFLFPEKYPDSFWIGRMTDSVYKQLYAETVLKFKDIENAKNDINLLYKHLKFYFPEVKIPRIISVVSDVDYRNKVVVTDSIVLIALDTYLGGDHPFYDGIHNYISKNFTEDQITCDLASEYAKRYIYQSQRKTLLDEMIYHGKILYFKDVMLPLKSDAEKIGYTREELEWAKANEREIWRYFVEREMLYSTDSKLPSRFINPAPFSKFYLELDNESPGRLGQYIGWQIVKAYMQNNDVDLKTMLITDAEEIFKNSKFKPQ